ncbi:hypothetical protein L596_004803 [Steinernema carpocapsae]|uniref:Major facilitator superfamily (MFS) profile domain-containing protein n=1 Tax=Steinernema carpocapsae TaxID=34508 RepID=A0A4U8UWX5_STECR|nr:hypothetical protein L596_004803 [Steinernema carpocapsae]
MAQGCTTKESPELFVSTPSNSYRSTVLSIPPHLSSSTEGPQQRQMVSGSSADVTLESAKKKARLWCKSSQRLRIALVLALALGIEGLLRSNINMAMVCMVNKTALIESSAARSVRSVTAAQLLSTDNFVAQNYTLTATLSRNPEAPAVADSQCAQPEETEERARVYNGDLPWTSREQAMIFTSFYMGGLAVVLPGGLLCEKYGAKFVVFWGAVINAVGTVMTPSVAYMLGPYAVMALRFIMGCGQGILVPCMNVLISCWFPAAEKSTALAISTTGNQFSVIIALFLTAELCQITALGGWAMSFYVYAVFGFVFCILWHCVVADHPESARVSPDELSYIHGENIHHVMSSRNSKPMPWKKILTSPVIWAIALSSFSQSFVTVGIVTYIPQYYKSILKMKLSSNGVMSALPFVIQLLTKILFAAIADILNKRKICTMNTVTKMFNLIASFGCGVCLIALTMVDCTQPLYAIVLVVTGVGLTSGYIPGYNTSIVCVAPIYTSGIASFCKLLAQIASVASPYMIGLLTKNGQLVEWQLVFYLISGVLFTTGLFFQISGSSEVQPWAKVEGFSEQPKPQETALLTNDGNVA